MITRPTLTLLAGPHPTRLTGAVASTPLTSPAPDLLTLAEAATLGEVTRSVKRMAGAVAFKAESVPPGKHQK